MDNTGKSNQSILKIESLKDFGADEIKWDEKKGVITLPNGNEYQVIIAWSNKSFNVKDLDKNYREAIVKNVQEVFKEENYRFTDLDQVKISKDSLMKGNSEIKKLQGERVKTISTLFSQVIQSVEKKDQKQKNFSEEEIQRAMNQSKKEMEKDEKYTKDIISFVSGVETTHKLRWERIHGGGDCLFEAALTGLKKMKKVGEKKTVAEFRRDIVAELEKGEYKERIQFQIIEDITRLKQASGNSENWEKEIAYYQNPLKDLYTNIVPLLEEPIEAVNIQNMVESENLADPVAVYLQTMATDKVYGSHLELAAIQSLYKVPIRLFSKDYKDGHYDINLPYKADKSEENLHLLFLRRHYDLFVPTNLGEEQ